MPAFQLVPLPAVNYDIDLYWPPPQIPHNVADPIDNVAAYHYGNNGAAGSLLVTAGGGTGNMAVSNQGFPIMQVASAPLGQQFNVTFSGFNIRCPLFAGGPPLLEYPVQYRVWRWQLTLMLQAVVVPTLQYLTFVGFINNGGGGPTAAGAGYFGLFLGLDSRWKFASRTGGAGGVGAFSDGPIDIGFPAVTTPHLVDFVMLAATGAAPAQLLIYLDGQYGAPVLARNWDITTTKLPGYATNGTPAGMSFQPCIFARDTGVMTVIQAGCMRFMAGQFLPNGIQVF